ncbi:hypothetical protein WJX74_004628 [Apatococcus lobatus]|uniref:FAS1 domain-containing protein n=1 Tax=Apatococcus lobatus TaxID=904363 RepID=A0AAW1S6N7_9CHLO
MQTAGPSPGSCGYGTLDPAQYPYGAVLSILSTDPLVAGLPLAGCGACFAITCNDRVNCKPPGGVQIRLIEYRPTLGGYLKLAVLDVAGSGGLTAVGVKSASDSSTNFINMTNTYGAVWELSNLPQPPLDVQLTNTAGQSLIARNAVGSQTQGVDVATSTQNSPAPVPPGPSPSPSPEAAPAPAPGPSFNPVPSPPSGAPCKTVTDILGGIPDLSTWLTEIQAGKLADPINTGPSFTILSPINSAFTAALPPSFKGETASSLLLSRSNQLEAILGYQVLKGGFPISSLTFSQSLPTTDLNGSVPLNVTVQSLGSGNGSGTTIQGTGTSAHILQADISACNSNVIHIMDGLLLPFAA